MVNHNRHVHSDGTHCRNRNPDRYHRSDCDVNSTAACALVGAKLCIPVAHLEAGLRSRDRTMPEEINRLVTDVLSELLLVSEPSGLENLSREGIPASKVRLVGNVMIDSLIAQLPAARSRQCARRLGLDGARYGLVTLHRPANVDEPATLARLVELLRELAEQMPLVFPVHPRTLNAVTRAGLSGRLRHDRLLCLGPQPYLDTLSLLAGAAVVLTDSGGVQEETSVLGVPCLTLRENTERPITIQLGTSRLVGNDSGRIRSAFLEAVSGAWPRGESIPLWDGQAGLRVARELAQWLARRSH